MADDKKKGGLPVLLGLGKSDAAAGDGADDMNEPDEGDEDMNAMASEILDAIDAKDPAAFAEALKAFCESC